MQKNDGQQNYDIRSVLLLCMYKVKNFPASSEEAKRGRLWVFNLACHQVIFDKKWNKMTVYRMLKTEYFHTYLMCNV